MRRIVAKFGGTSVGSPERIRHVADLMHAVVEAGDQPIVVVSAMAGETDRLLGLAQAFETGLGDREVDVMLAAGEQVSAALTAVALRERGLKAQSIMGWQAPVITTGPHGAAAIDGMDTGIFETLLERGIIPVLAGYQGINPDADLQTLGRGGTDLSAAALAAALDARCDIYTDVDGVYTTDPRLVPEARRLDSISHDEMLELAAQGAKVLQPRSVEFAKAHKVPMRVLSSFADAGKPQGTDIVADTRIAERRLVSGIAYVRDQARLALHGKSEIGPLAGHCFQALAAAGIGVDMIVQTQALSAGGGNLEFSVAHKDLDAARRAMENVVGETQITTETGLAKVSIIGAGLRQRADIARSLFGVLGEGGIEVKVLSTSEIKISALIENAAIERAVRALHATYGLDQI